MTVTKLLFGHAAASKKVIVAAREDVDAGGVMGVADAALALAMTSKTMTSTMTSTSLMRSSLRVRVLAAGGNQEENVRKCSICSVGANNDVCRVTFK